MRSAERWVHVQDADGRSLGVRMLNFDTFGRPCVRYQKEWRRLRERKTSRGVIYILGD